MNNIVVVKETLDLLPFKEALTWERYQSLCTDILYKLFNSSDSRDYLSKGHNQDGIDVYSFDKGDNEKRVAQCKLEKYTGPKQIEKIIETFLNGNLVENTKEFILCTSFDLGKLKNAEDATIKARAKLAEKGIDLRVWDARGLSTVLRTNSSPDILHIISRYFGENVTLSFYGEVWTDYVKKLS